MIVNKLYGQDFEKFRVLSLAISDTLNEDRKDKIYHEYLVKEKFEDLRDEYDNISEKNDIAWDNMITILVIEQGADEILSVILDANKESFLNILHSIAIRMREPSIEKKYIEIYERELADADQRIEKILNSKYQQYNKWRNEVKINIMKRALINAASKKEFAYPRFIENLYVKINNFDNLMFMSVNKVEKIIYVNKMLERTFRFLIVFYEGLFGYARNDLENIDKMSDLHCNSFKSFEEAATSAAKKIAKLSLGKLFDVFVKLCESVYENPKDLNKRKLSKCGKYLDYYLGRSYICYDNNLGKNYKGKIIPAVNYEKHDDYRIPKNNREKDEFFLKAKELLTLFIFNKDEKKERLSDYLISLDPIYPFVVNFHMHQDFKDGYSIKSYKVNTNDMNYSKDITLLSSQELDRDKEYYCIPNISSSSSKWWIEPFLIKCEVVDKILFEAK